MTQRQFVPEDLQNAFFTSFSSQGVDLTQATGQASAATFVFDLASTFQWFEGHYPQAPVLPGIVQLHCATALGQALFGQAHSADLKTVEEVAQLKFKNMIVPGDRVALLLKFDVDKNSLRFEYRHPDQDNQLCSSGRICFSPVDHH